MFIYNFFFFFGCIMQLAGPQFPDQGLNLGPGSDSAESQPLDHQGIPPKAFLIESICEAVGDRLSPLEGNFKRLHSNPFPFWSVRPQYLHFTSKKVETGIGEVMSTQWRREKVGLLCQRAWGCGRWTASMVATRWPSLPSRGKSASFSLASGVAPCL